MSPVSASEPFTSNVLWRARWRLRSLRCRLPWRWAHTGPFFTAVKPKPGDVHVIPASAAIGAPLFSKCQWCGTTWETNALGEWVRRER